MALPQPAVSKPVNPHLITHRHEAVDTCPLCDQPIPKDRIDEINHRIETLQRENEAQLTAQLKEQFGREKAEALELAKREANAALTAQVEHARSEERLKADTILRDRLADAERLKKEAEATMRAEVEQATAAKTAAEQSGIALQAQIEQARADQKAEIQKIQKEAEEKAVAIRETALKDAEAAMLDRIKASDQAKSDAEAKAQAAEQQVLLLNANHEADVARRLEEQRAVLETATTQAINAEKSAAFEEKQKLMTKVEDLQRSLDKKTADELGEGAEIDLFDALKKEFEDDRIERIKKGQPGADILHVVMHNGKECGRIIYDSKNHDAWRNDFVTKLASDQMAAKADHAILATRKFPAGTRHIHVQDGVIIAGPARVTAIVQIIRHHIVTTHGLRLSDQARSQKTAALYDFITSQRCKDLLTRIDTHTDDLLEIQVKEQRAHEAVWKKQGELIRSVQKVRAELCNEIDGIIGFTVADEQASNE